MTAQLTVQGITQLDSSWSKDIYVSEIRTLQDMYKAGNHLIIKRVTIDTSGNWRFNIEEPKNDMLLRLHVRRKSDPVTSLVIGSKLENFGFVAIGKDRNITMVNDKKSIISSFNTTDSPLNKELHHIKKTYDFWVELDLSSHTKAEMIAVRKKAADDLFQIADTTNAILPAIYAANLANFGFNNSEVTEQMNSIYDRLGDHPYLSLYKTYEKPNRTILIYSVAFVIVGLGLYYFRSVFIMQYRKRQFNTLSFRERDVVQLAVDGKTNKEIANQLNIELNTVKTHLKNIYSKLEISSRRELSKYNDHV
ncbi:response regulator transcription factor [Portibacter marinus]|uniref:response regulator transcription factor n=1 Tax=Portibacter marinus TaxID=2898660 RepID=UPI001F3DA661|nr:helix-turn-helix transcriptional regulator [Portibacter marinus]